jgi:hypothetical protein
MKWVTYFSSTIAVFIAVAYIAHAAEHDSGTAGLIAGITIPARLP